MFALRPWSENEDPVEHRRRPGRRPPAGWRSRTGPGPRFVLALQQPLPGADWRPASTVTGPLRAVKDAAEIEALAAASAAADRVAAQLLGRRHPA